LVENSDDQEVQSNSETPATEFEESSKHEESTNPDSTTNNPGKVEETEVVVAEEDLEPVPDLCAGNFDSVAYLNGAIYIFKGSFIWEFNSRFELEDDFPMKISKVFPNLPKRFKKIDAVYEIPEDDEIVFFSGSEYITYDIRGPIYTAYNITRYTNDPDIEKIDAAMIWGEFECWLINRIPI
jgi:Hemopexin